MTIATATTALEAAHQRYIEAKKRVDELIPIFDAAEGAKLSRVRSELMMAVSVKNLAEDELFAIYDSQSE